MNLQQALEYLYIAGPGGRVIEDRCGSCLKTITLDFSLNAYMTNKFHAPNQVFSKPEFFKITVVDLKKDWTPFNQDRYLDVSVSLNKAEWDIIADNLREIDKLNDSGDESDTVLSSIIVKLNKQIGRHAHE